jgi:phage gp29-like protein
VDSRPTGNPFRSLPIQTFSGFDTVYSINQALIQLEQGNFNRAALVSDSTGRDDRISGVTSTRVGALLAANLDVKPADDRAKTAKYAEMLGGTEDAPGRWDRMVSPGVLAKTLKAGMHLNMGISEILWSYEDGMYWPRLKYWHSQFVRWDQSYERYKLLTADQGEIALPRLEENTESEGRWFMWCPFGYQFAWLDGLIRALAPMYMRRMWNNRDWSRYNEVHGLPITKAISPGNGGKGTSDDEFLQAVANRGAEPTILLKQGEDGNKYDVELLEAVAKTYETFKDSKSDVNTDIAVLILGQNLTTEAKGGGLGGGEAKTHNLVRLDKAREDAAIANAIYNQVLRPWARFNFKDPEYAPRPVFRVDPPEDEAGKAAVLKGIGDGITSLTTAKVPINIRETAEEFGLVLLSEEEAAAQEAVAKEEEAARLASEMELKMGGQAGGAGGAGPAGPAKKPPITPGDETKSKRAALAGSDMADKIPRPVVARYKFAGLDIAVENPRGTTRTWSDASGATVGSTLMLHDYGFIEGQAGSDGQDLDCYIGPNEDAAHVHLVHQLRAPEFTAHDEDKVMLGFRSPEAAKTAYLAHRADGAAAFGGMSVVTLDRFKVKLKRRTSDGKIRASAKFDPTFDAIMAMSDPAVVALRARTVKGKKPKRYPDKLTERAVKLGARALASDLTGLRGEINDATSFPDLEKRLITYYRDEMDATKLARIVHRTRLMANLTGRLSVVKGA